MENITVWLDKIQNTCQQIGQTYIDIIIDQCGLDFSVIPALSGFSPSVQWASLYEGLPEDIHRDDAPLLVRIELGEEQQVRWMYDLACEIQHKAPLLIIGSLWSLPSLAQWLGQCADACHEERAGIFRFWDTRIFPYLFTAVLTDAHKQQLNQPAMFWSWLDRDKKPALLSGNGAMAAQEACQKIIFNDHQFETLMCLCDAKRFLTYQPLPETLFATKEEMFSACFNAMLAATQKGLLFEDQRDDWALHCLTQ